MGKARVAAKGEPQELGDGAPIQPGDPAPARPPEPVRPPEDNRAQPAMVMSDVGVLNLKALKSAKITELAHVARD
ncbi:MAG: hypothetical protein ABSD31_16375, partial [Candidatus Binataceae bacterium]